MRDWLLVSAPLATVIYFVAYPGQFADQLGENLAVLTACAKGVTCARSGSVTRQRVRPRKPPTNRCLIQKAAHSRQGPFAAKRDSANISTD
jgi:hypothetical protein